MLYPEAIGRSLLLTLEKEKTWISSQNTEKMRRKPIEED